ncbi:MAG: ATP-dependent DNA helicase [Chloroflexi bacterium]|nr:ATP-dependent DNA helicase [Chloroflexota bacterium]
MTKRRSLYSDSTVSEQDLIDSALGEDDFAVPAPDLHARTAEGPDAESMAQLANSDLAEFFGSNGPLSNHLAGYELRPSQLEMAETVKRALLNPSNALIEAPTGTGKSIAYLVPAILSGKTIVVATANKSLQSQLFYKDIPFLREVMNLPISAVIVKGRSNFVCNYKWEKELAEQQYISLYDKADEQVSFLRSWLEETDTGDVDDLPFLLSNDLRPRLVSFPDDCLHGDCRYYEDDCWVNHMRDKASEAQILITNHHLLLNVLELGWAGERILPPASVYIIDEAHQLEQTATSVFETNVTDYTVEQLLGRSIFKEHFDSDELDQIRFQNTLAFQEIAHLSRDNSFRIEPELEELKKLGRSLGDMAQRLKRESPYGEKAEAEKQADSKQSASDDRSEERKAYEMAIEILNSTSTKLLTIATSKHDDDFVRYAARVFDRRHTTLEVHAAPINPATLLTQYLFHPEEAEGASARTVICTSATLSTNRNFTHFKQRCGLLETSEERVLPAVFDYPRQALLYQPALPAYDYRNADAYYSAVAHEIERLLEASRGRALCLFTSWSGLQQVQERLQKANAGQFWPTRAQGDAPRDALLSWFKETPHSVLLATRSFWEGVDIPGDNLSLVVMDKMPFPTPGDPLHSARMKAIDESGQSSFGDYMTPLMTLALKQGFGRLIRRATDCGVVAILDERLSSKSYGRQARQDLPPARFSRDFKDVHKFFQQTLNSAAEFGLNVWATAANQRVNLLDDEAVPQAMIQWRWQLLRLQDGKADGQEGRASDLADAFEGEIHAALLGLLDLRQRIERAGRPAKQFGVEVRCSQFAANMMEQGPASGLIRRWAAECSHWKSVQVLALEAAER